MNTKTKTDVRLILTKDKNSAEIHYLNIDSINVTHLGVTINLLEQTSMEVKINHNYTLIINDLTSNGIVCDFIVTSVKPLEIVGVF